MLNKKTKEYDFNSIYPNKKTISSSQFLGYEQNPQKFYFDYILGVRKEPSNAMMIGQIFSQLHLDRNYDFRQALAEIKAPKRITDLFDRVIKRFPVVPAEIPLICQIGKWKLRATLDGFVEDSWTIIENKTGGVPWTQERTNFSDQITFQAFTHWKKYGIQPRQIILNWVNTNSGANQELISYKTTRSIKGLKMFERRVECVLENIEAENWTKNIYGY